MFSVTIYKNRTCDYTVPLDQVDGTDVVLGATDVVRFKVWRRDAATPDLDIDSVAALSGGSLVTIDNIATGATTVRFGQGDTSSMDPGVYNAEVSVVDDTETNPLDAIKIAEHGIVHLLGSGGGEIAKA